MDHCFSEFKLIKVVPQEGDKVKYRVIPIPPKYEKTQAVQVTVQNEDQLLAKGRQTWAQSNEELKESVENFLNLVHLL